MRARLAVVQGVVGSLMMFVGSLGTGWIANGSPMMRHPLVIELRVNVWGVYTCTALLTLGAMLLIRSWLRLGQRLRGWPPGSLRTVVTAVVAWSLPLLFAVPIYSRDVYAYIGQGRLMLAGKDPYVEGISTLDNWFMLGADPEWAEARTPYGPYFLWIAAAVVRLTSAQPDLSVLLFRLAAYAGVVLCLVYVPKLARLHGVNGARALWISVANPLFLISFVASAHNDALMVGLAVAGVYFAASKHPLLGILLVTGSIGIKPITVLLLPFVGLLWAGRGASWTRRFLTWAATAALSFGLLVLSGWVDGLGVGWAWAFLDPTPGYTGYSPSGFLGQQLERFGNSLGKHGDAWAHLLRKILQAAAVLLVLVLMFVGGDRKIVRRMAVGFSAVVLLSPIIQPWYILWLIPFLAATGIRNNWQIRIIYIVVTFFVVFGAQDQLSVWPFVDLSVSVSQVAFVLAVAFTLYLALVDPRTRTLLTHGGWRGWFGPGTAQDSAEPRPPQG
ncbi:polyprenol phosphomannose-dependent alpha 1,6 mannosyltransferase MptB [Kocuria sp.]|uniref:polyprenol phosphomannose-dependent alpha 1,6 mannosyltransferase MptB n=1 Tax=Kocuria sp. TaxID=1871328 RepID=UPI0026DBC72A|nr:polyprenol phosphomannose-dependent alpha 1,6 mannosyltransferase MptB [Kocuria sp.]MDO4917963.1 polyprenol phosphomannose-dependent alpha 1,6 mannosyltransferase MptB [Kocuria sp.]